VAKRYTVKNDAGRTVTFDWHGDQPPTDDDMAEVFAAAPTPKAAPSNPMAGIAAGLGGAAAATAGALPALEQFATSPGVANAISKVAGAGRLIPGVGTGAATAASLAYGIGKGEDLDKLAARGVGGFATSYAAKLLKEGGKFALRRLQPTAASAAEALATRLGAPAGSALGLGGEVAAIGTAPAAVPLAGGIAGLAIPATLLAGIQHDANRKVTIDYSKEDTPDTAVARVFMNMRNSEANKGRTLDERMDDPNDVMFRADDSADAETAESARAALLAKLGAVSARGGL
jgi:hypothetical protein